MYRLVVMLLTISLSLSVSPTADAATAFLIKTHAPGHGDVLCYYRTQDRMRKVVRLPNGSTCPATIEVD